jgi:hypothetical protein
MDNVLQLKRTVSQELRAARRHPWRSLGELLLFIAIGYETVKWVVHHG